MKVWLVCTGVIIAVLYFAYIISTLHMCFVAWFKPEYLQKYYYYEPLHKSLRWMFPSKKNLKHFYRWYSVFLLASALFVGAIALFVIMMFAS